MIPAAPLKKPVQPTGAAAPAKPASTRLALTKAQLINRVAPRNGVSSARLAGGRLKNFWTRQRVAKAVRILVEEGVVVGYPHIRAAGHGYVCLAIQRQFGSIKALKRFLRTNKARFVTPGEERAQKALQVFRERASALHDRGVKLNRESRAEGVSELRTLFNAHKGWGFTWPKLVADSIGVSLVEFYLDHAVKGARSFWARGSRNQILEAVCILKARHGELTSTALVKLRKTSLLRAIHDEPTLRSVKKAVAEAPSEDARTRAVNAILRRQITRGLSLTMEGFNFRERAAIAAELKRRFNRVPEANAFQALKQEAGVELNPAYDPKKHGAALSASQRRTAHFLATPYRTHADAVKSLGASVNELCDEVAAINNIVRAELQKEAAARARAAQARQPQSVAQAGARNGFDPAKLDLSFDWKPKATKLPPDALSAILALQQAKRRALKAGASAEQADDAVRAEFEAYVTRSKRDRRELLDALREAEYHYRIATGRL